MKKEDILDFSEILTSLTFTEQERAITIKLVNLMALSYFIYDMTFRNLVKEHKLAVGEDRTGKVHFLLADRPYTYKRFENMFMRRMMCSI